MVTPSLKTFRVPTWRYTQPMADLMKIWTSVRYPVTRHENWVFCALISRSLVRLDNSVIGIKKSARAFQAKLLFLRHLPLRCKSYLASER